MTVLKLESSLETDVASISKNNTTEQPLVSRLEMNAVFILKNNATVLKLVSSRETGVASIRKNYTTEQPLVSHLKSNAAFILENNVTVLKLLSSRETGVASIRKNYTTEEPLVSRLEMNAAFILETNTTELRLIFSRETDVASIRKNNSSDLTLASSLATISSLLPFSITVLSFNFHCITCIFFTYHPTLYHSYVTWIEYILPILQLLISSFYLKYKVLVSHRDPNGLCPIESLAPLIQSAIPS